MFGADAATLMHSTLTKYTPEASGMVSYDLKLGTMSILLSLSLLVPVHKFVGASKTEGIPRLL